MTTIGTCQVSASLFLYSGIMGRDSLSPKSLLPYLLTGNSSRCWPYTVVVRNKQDGNEHSGQYMPSTQLVFGTCWILFLLSPQTLLTKEKIIRIIAASS
jgi:hypothetical protein